MKEARLKSTINRIYAAGSTLQLSAADFDLYENGALSGYTLSLDEYFQDIAIRQPFALVGPTGVGYNSIALSAYKHVNSISIADDELGNHYNTYADDLSKPINCVLNGAIVHPQGGAFTINEVLVYCPAMFYPQMTDTRLRNVLRSSGTTFHEIFGNAQLNEQSPVYPNKTAPHCTDECNGYSPNFAPVLVDIPSGPLEIGEGQETYHLDVYYTANNPNSPAGTSLITIADASKSNLKAAGDYITVIFTPGLHTVQASYRYNSITYYLPTKQLQVLPAVQNVTVFDITSLTLNNSARVTANLITGKQYTVLCTTFWENPFEMPSPMYSYDKNLGTYSFAAGSGQYSIPIPTTQPPAITGNVDYTMTSFSLALVAANGTIIVADVYQVLNNV